MGELNPEFKVPLEGATIWSWFLSLNSSVSRTSEGHYKIIPPSEYVAWSKMTGNIVYPEEYDILRSMDEVFCIEANLELDSIKNRREEERKRQIEEANSKRKFSFGRK